MRARNIKPGYYANEDLAECTIAARYIFPGLWMLADKEGRLEDRPKRIKGELLRFDTIDIEPLLAELASKKDAQGVPFIIRYRNPDGRFIQIPKFRTHQSPHYSEKDSTIKPPILPESAGHDGPTFPDAQAIKRGAQPPDLLNPDSLNHESLNGASKPGRAKKQKPTTATAKKSPHAELVAYFCERWQAKRGAKYHFTSADAKHAQTVLDAADGDPGHAKRIVDRYLADTDQFVAVKQGHTLAWLASKVNSYTADPPRPCGCPPGWPTALCVDGVHAPESPSNIARQAEGLDNG